ncbi:hypothetical protein [Rubritepida flocculans]|uniref:hypothetical protein n=1 Tax=Rubritepida flocculans TaxID=182403 RepID=UPI00041290E6|nr:hypothetical protein [Rubritepida flocculans]
MGGLFGGGGRGTSAAMEESLRRQEEALARQEAAVAQREEQTRQREEEQKAREEANRRARAGAYAGRALLLAGPETGTEDQPERGLQRKLGG